MMQARDDEGTIQRAAPWSLCADQGLEVPGPGWSGGKTQKEAGQRGVTTASDQQNLSTWAPLPWFHSHHSLGHSFLSSSSYHEEGPLGEQRGTGPVPRASSRLVCRGV